MARRLIALALVAVGILVAAPMASADTGEIIEPQNSPPTALDGWQAGTCVTDEPVSGEPKIKCSPQTAGAFFTEAAGHPPIGFTQYTIQHEPFTPLPSPPFPEGAVIAPIKEPEENRSIRTLRVDLPPGLTVNPNATPQKCSVEDFERVVGENIVPNCPSTTIVGREEVTLVTNEENFPAPGTPKGFVIPPSEGTGTKVAVYNLEPKAGEPALFGFVIAGEEEVFLETEVAWESDFHESFTIHLPPPGHLPDAKPLSTLISRLINNGKSTGDGTYINNPTTCYDPAQAAYAHLYSTWFRAESYGVPDPSFPDGSTPVEAKVQSSTGELLQQSGCDTVPFNPGIDVSPGTSSVDSPAAPTVNTTLDYLTGGESDQQESHLRSAAVTLPEGMGLNPTGSKGLVACSDAQFKKGVRAYDNDCPAASKVGRISIETPPLPAGSLKGDIYVGTQKSFDPTSGEEFRVLAEAKSEDEGIAVRLVGHVVANPTTGQLTTIFNEQEIGPLAGKLPTGLPQVPFTSVKLYFPGSKAILSSPPTCSAAETTGKMEPWARPGEQVPVTSKFTLSDIAGGGTCPKTLAERPFKPYYLANSDSTTAGAYSPFRVHITRFDGQQELKGASVKLPPGLTGKLAGLTYCPNASVQAAIGKTGKQTIAAPPCGASSYVGVASVTAGTGAHPLTLPGTVYLTGPYKGAPVSLAVVTPAVSGPFDLGTAVVKIAINVDPETAQINAVSDPIPDVFGGVKLDVRAIDFAINRSEFMLNPTHCGQGATINGFIQGGGGNPAAPAAWSNYPVSVGYQSVGCGKLKFKPRLYTRLSGPTKRGKNPQIRAVLQAQKGNANIARTALTLPHTLFLDQSHIGTVCTRVQLAAQQCPKASIYGHAKAKTPLLDGMLRGPVYLVSSDHELPDLLADLRGQVDIRLRGVISSKRGGLKTVFNNTPDVPVNKFILNMSAGKKSLLQNSANLCKEPQLAVLNIKGHNSRRVKNNKYRLNVKACGGKKKGKK